VSAYADEFAAFHLGQINRKRGWLIELLEKAGAWACSELVERSEVALGQRLRDRGI
jgi:hypothetical protein